MLYTAGSGTGDGGAGGGATPKPTGGGANEPLDLVQALKQRKPLRKTSTAVSLESNRK